VALIFAIMNWADCKKPFFIWLGGFVIAIIGAVGAVMLSMPT